MLEIVGSLSGGGKSAYLQNKVARNPNRSFLFLTMELHEVEIVRRIGLMSKVLGFSTKDKFKFSRKKKKAMKKFYGEKTFENNRGLLTRKGGSLVKQIVIGSQLSEIEKLISECNVDEVYLDSMSFLEIGQESVYKTQKPVLDALYKLSKKVDITTSVSLSRYQHNKGVENIEVRDLVPNYGREVHNGSVKVITTRRVENILKSTDVLTKEEADVLDWNKYSEEFKKTQ
jgi:hypothetical protein